MFYLHRCLSASDFKNVHLSTLIQFSFLHLFKSRIWLRTASDHLNTKGRILEHRTWTHQEAENVQRSNIVLTGMIWPRADAFWTTHSWCELKLYKSPISCLQWLWTGSFVEGPLVQSGLLPSEWHQWGGYIQTRDEAGASVSAADTLSLLPSCLLWTCCLALLLRILSLWLRGQEPAGFTVCVSEREGGIEILSVFVIASRDESSSERVKVNTAALPVKIPSWDYELHRDPKTLQIPLHREEAQRGKLIFTFILFNRPVCY